MLRRLIDLTGIAALEQKALMNPRYTDADARAYYPEIDACSLALLGLTADAAGHVERPVGWDDVEHAPIRDQVIAFEREDWDVTDDRRRPLRMLEHFNVQLWLEVRGVAGSLPFVSTVEADYSSAWSSSLQAEAIKFRRGRR